jgi:hypothetical protein
MSSEAINRGHAAKGGSATDLGLQGKHAIVTGGSLPFMKMEGWGGIWAQMGPNLAGRLVPARH